MPEVIGEIDQLNGKTIRVAGYLGTCAGNECRLFVDRAGRVAHQIFVDRAIRVRDLVRSGVKSDAGAMPTSLPPDSPSLGVGGGALFDRKAGQFQNSFVVITGKASSYCRGPSAHPGCSGRSDIEPSDIVSLKDK